MAAMALLAARPAGAQAGADSAHAEFGEWQVGPWIGGARNSPTGFLGTIPGRSHLFVAVQALTPILRAGPLRVSYGVEVLPFVMILGRTVPPEYAPPETPAGVPGRPDEPDRAYAVGISPFGVDLAVLSASRVSLFGDAAAGGLIFTRPFPVPQAQRINFTLEFGGGLRVRTGAAEWLQLGYRYHHLSNAYTALLNPGLDANVIYAGYLWRARLPR